MWSTILAIVAFIIIRFFYDKSKQSSKIAKEGGMQLKYAELIQELKENFTGMDVINESSDVVSLGLSTPNGAVLFEIMQTFKKVTVILKINDTNNTIQRKEWDFPEYGNQKRMVDIIEQDLEQ